MLSVRNPCFSPHPMCGKPAGIPALPGASRSLERLYKLLFSLLSFASRTPEKLTLNEVLFAATIKKAMPGDTTFILEISCNHRRDTGIKAKCQLWYTNPRAGKSVWLLCHNVKRHQRPSALQKCAAGRAGGSPGGPSALHTARGCGGGGQFKELSFRVRVHRREDLRGFSFVGGCLCTGGPRNSSVVLQVPGWEGGGSANRRKLEPLRRGEVVERPPVPGSRTPPLSKQRASEVGSLPRCCCAGGWRAPTGCHMQEAGR